MRRTLILTAIVLPLPAHAHVGHLGELAGHSHWIALGALGIATAVGALASAKGRDRDADPEEEAAPEDDTDAQEVPA